MVIKWEAWANSLAFFFLLLTKFFSFLSSCRLSSPSLWLQSSRSPPSSSSSSLLPDRHHQHHLLPFFPARATTSPALLRSACAVLVTLVSAIVLTVLGFAAATPSSFSCYCWSCWAVPLLLLSISNINSTSSRHPFAVPSCCCCRGCCCRGCPSSLHRL